MRKRILSTILATIMSICVLAGCGDNTSKTEESKSSVATSTSQKTETSSVAEVKEDPVTVKWLVAQNEPTDLKMVMEDLNKKLVEEINVKLELVCIPGGEYNDRTKLASTSGEDYDIVFTSSWRNKFDENMSRGALLDITDLIEEYGQDIKAGLQPELWDVATVGGRLYAIPNQQITAHQIGIYVQKEYADKYGLTVKHVADGSEIEWFLDKIKENEPDMTPIHISQTPFARKWESLSGLCSVAISDDPSDGLTVEWDVDDERAAAIRDWYEKGYLHPEFATGGDMNAVKAANKFVAFCGTYSPYGHVGVSNSQGKEYVCISVGEPFFGAVAGKETMLGINVNSKNPEAAVKLINLFWANDELFNELLFGLEGVHYKKVAEKRVEVIEGTDWNFWKSDWAMGNQFLRWYVPGEEDDCWDVTSAMNRSSEVSPVRGFIADVSELQVEQAQISAVTAEYENYYFRENWQELQKEYKEKLKEAGIETVQKEVQRQLDEWLAANK